MKQVLALLLAIFVAQGTFAASNWCETNASEAKKAVQASLWNAIENHDIATLLNLLATPGIDLSYKTEYSRCETPLMQSIRLADLQIMDILIASGANVNEEAISYLSDRGKENKYSPITYAAEQSADSVKTVARLLKQADLDPNKIGNLKETALLLSIKRARNGIQGAYEVATMLAKDPRVKVELKSTQDEFALMEMIKNVWYAKTTPFDLNLLKLLVARSEESVNLTSQWSGDTVAFFYNSLNIAIRTMREDVFDAVFASPYLKPFEIISDYYSRTWSSVDEAIRDGNQHAAEKLLSRKDIPRNLVAASIWKASISAARHSQDVYDWVLAQPALNPNSLNEHGTSLLEQFASLSNSEAVKILLARGDADVNINNGGPLKTAKSKLASCLQSGPASKCGSANIIVLMLKKAGARDN